MIETFSVDNFHHLCDQTAAIDEDLASIVEAHGYPPMWTRPNSFETLVHIILEQQVSLASALAALRKLQERTTDLTPQNILSLSDEELKACYVSRQKSVYIRSLAEALNNNSLNLSDLEVSNEESIRARLIKLKGIGNWTVDIYLMFVLRRTDIFPIGDLAAVNALKRAKNLPNDISRESIIEITQSWKPFRTIATMILWHHYLSSPLRRKL